VPLKEVAIKQVSKEDLYDGRGQNKETLISQKKVLEEKKRKTLANKKIFEDLEKQADEEMLKDSERSKGKAKIFGGGKSQKAKQYRQKILDFREMYLPEGRDDLIAFLQQLPEKESIYWLGLGSNLLVRDGGIKGTVINTRGRLKVMQLVDTGKVYVEAGVPCAHVARFCTELGLTGAEFLAGIPGTMGGALKMNAGAFGSETWNIVNKVEMIDAKGHVTQRKSEQFEVAYRSVKGLEGQWFLAVELALKSGESEHSLQRLNVC
jgi:hypothetical protein